MCKVLYFQQNSVFGSAERYLYDVADAMSEYGFDIHLACPSGLKMESYRLLETRRVTVHWINNQHYRHNALVALPYWVRFFRELQPSIIHFNDPCLVGAVAARIARIPHRVMMHHTPEMHREFSLTGRIFEWLAFRSYTKVIFSNRLSLANGMKNDNIPEGKCVVIPFGLHPDWFIPIDGIEIERTRQSLNLHESDIAILCPARLSRQKRHDLLIQAAQEVTKHVNNVVFFLAGDGELKEDIVRWISDAGLTSRVKLMGYRSDIQAIMTASDLVVLASDFEGFPYVLMEAAARGIPAVSTDVGGVRHSIKHEETGLLVPPGDSGLLATALLSLIIDAAKRRRFSHAAREYAEQAFTKDKLVENTARFYRSLLVPTETTSN